MSDEWNDDYESGGITMGPEDRLEREIAKSKALKVERLQLRDRISRLEEDVASLGRENTELASKLVEAQSKSSDPPDPDTAEHPGDSCSTNTAGGNCWSKGGVVIFFIAAALLCARWYFG